MTSNQSFGFESFDPHQGRNSTVGQPEVHQYSSSVNPALVNPSSQTVPPVHSAQTSGFDAPMAGFSPVIAVRDLERNAEPNNPQPRHSKISLDFNDRSIRMAFIRKVYVLLSAMLMVVAATIAVFIFVPAVKEFAQSDKGLYVYIASYCVFLVVYIMIVCCKKIRRGFPQNYIVLFLLTASMSFMTGMISSYHHVELVFTAMAITAVSCLAITLFTFNSKYDITSIAGAIYIVGICLALFGICFGVFWRVKIPYLQAVYGGIMALLCMAYFAIDTKMLVGGGRYEVSEEDHIFIVTELFMDLILIFLYLLRVFGGGGGGNCDS